jgi:hypothetical protein
MPCPVCGSGNQQAFTAEINIHFRGLANIDHPGVLVFPRLLVCLDCGCSRFSTPAAELSELVRGAARAEAPTRGRNDAILFRPRIKLEA